MTTSGCHSLIHSTHVSSMCFGGPVTVLGARETAMNMTLMEESRNCNDQNVEASWQLEQDNGKSSNCSDLNLSLLLPLETFLAPPQQGSERRKRRQRLPGNWVTPKAQVQDEFEAPAKVITV